MTDPHKIITVLEAVLERIDQTVSTMPQLVSEGDTDALAGKIQTYQAQIARVKSALQKQRSHEKRKRELETQNRQNDPNS
ncbi:MAG: hypothetical protein P4N60_07725 [Verrucomicrobiae bacterium]|nr:hypothetical protein [Verrucomicrobiae bacterium]